MKVKMRLGENIKRLRGEKGWSQTELSKKAGVHLTHIHNIENGKYVPSLEFVTKVAQLFGVSLDQLVYSSEGAIEEVKIEDQNFAQRIKLLNTLNDKEREVVTEVIDAMLTKKKMFELLTNKEELVGK